MKTTKRYHYFKEKDGFEDSILKRPEDTAYKDVQGVPRTMTVERRFRVCL